MRTTAIILAAATLILVGMSLPGDVAIAGTASANICTPHLMEGDVKGYVACTEAQCNWDEWPKEPLVCTD